MTTKKLIKELMGLNISRNTARRIVRVAREDGIPNADTFYMVCAELVRKIEHDLKCSIDELAKDIDLDLKSSDMFVWVGETDTGYNGDLPSWEYD